MVANHPFGTQFEQPTADHRWAGPTSECMCGHNMYYLAVVFDPNTRLPGFYLTDAMCTACGAIVKAPTPVDDVPPMPTEDELDDSNPLSICPSCLNDTEVVRLQDGRFRCDWWDCNGIEWGGE